MPELPTVTVTAAQAARILNAYRAKYGTTSQAETVAAYKKDLVEHVRELVIQHEARAIMATQQVERLAMLDQARNELPDPDTTI